MGEASANVHSRGSDQRDGERGVALTASAPAGALARGAAAAARLDAASGAAGLGDRVTLLV
jgi:hypothetical protein